jgi:hypothetical protein
MGTNKLGPGQPNGRKKSCKWDFSLAIVVLCFFFFLFDCVVWSSLYFLGGGGGGGGEGEGIQWHDSFRNFGNNLFRLLLGRSNCLKIIHQTGHHDGTLQSVWSFWLPPRHNLGAKSQSHTKKDAG